jgi:hypothetical protein
VFLVADWLKGFKEALRQPLVLAHNGKHDKLSNEVFLFIFGSIISSTFVTHSQAKRSQQAFLNYKEREREREGGGGGGRKLPKTNPSKK